MYLYWGHLAKSFSHLGRGVDEGSNKKRHKREGVHSKKWCLSPKFFYILYSVTQFFSFLVSHKAPIILQWATKRAHPRKCLYYNSTTLSMWVVYTHVCLKFQLCLKIWFSASFDITRYAEAAIYAKNLLFSHSIVS